MTRMTTPLCRRRTFVLATGLVAALPLARTARAQSGLRPIKVGITAGPQAGILDVVKANAAREGLRIEVVEFTDFIQPNAALAAGDIDANSFQHRPYLEQQIKDRGYRFTAIAETLVAPIGIYSKKIRSLAAFPEGGRFGLPNDPTNGARALLLLQKQGLIKLRAEAGTAAGVLDIADNPRKIRMIELAAAQLARALEDVDAAAINTNFAIPAGLKLAEALAVEGPDSPYANVIVVRSADKDRPEFAKLVAAYRSPEVKKYIDDTFKGAVIATW
jgi:D-methionine transport system substrate-binding protein